MAKLKTELEIENDLYMKALESAQNKISTLENNVQQLKHELELKDIELNSKEIELNRFRLKERELHEILSSNCFEPVKNERNAGRKPLLTDEVKEQINQYRAKGMTFREISKSMGLSLGVVHKASR